MERILVVDGMNLLFQMFYGMPARILSPQGRPIHGTLGFVGALLKIIRRVQPTHVAVLFDGECQNDRTELDEAYKANRPDYSQMEEEETPFCQLPDVYAALDYLGITHAETTDCEADDWLAGFAKQYGCGREVVIASFDSDLFQLIDDHVRILRYRGEKTVICDRIWLWEKYGIRPEQYAAFKSLTGDNADNIRGVRGVGPKTAAWLMQSFGDLQSLLANAESITKPAVRAAVLASIPRIKTNYLLIKLSGEGALPFTLEDMRYRYDGISTGQVMTALGLRQDLKKGR